MITLENKKISVNISKNGAELMSLYHKVKQREYLWQGDSQFWQRRSPVLFPIVGRLAENSYYVNGTRYMMTQHGFARDHVFDVIEHKENEASFILRSSEESLKQYPFLFSLIITYRLNDNELLVKWKIMNEDDEIMYFQIGAHPAFNVGDASNRLEDYHLHFGKDVTLETKLLDPSTGLVTKGTKQVALNTSRLNLNYDLFKQDALILEGINRVTLQSNNQNHYVEMIFDSFPLLGIWTPIHKEKTPFICLEPWYGLADTVTVPRELKEKAYINKLKSGETFDAYYTIKIG
ncbi:aldose 1-epimerase family protein [Haloplasma contractile]|uniref:Aldose 1-epimerase protein n=1 Tax=Haloplasma contractile SSD-17B TaxID=1033810 RepID=U2EE79_9MOLU|nr:aldose 1-epimerase family protein [Haloplasma contractile]ERJ13001.1 aldose 1-epimerase protein [Haloplasma contractile SSD-17B]